MSTRFRLAAALLLGPLAAAGWPHARSVSYSFWDLDGPGARVEMRAPLIELTRFPEGTAPPGYFPKVLELTRGDQPCEVVDGPRAVPETKGWAVVRWTVRCSAAGRASIRSRVLLDVAPSHVHFARVNVGGTVVERVLAASDPVWELPEQAETGAGFVRYVTLGIEHILSGWDHLAFVLALVLLATRLGEVATLVTGFTIGHSVTLALAVTGMVRPQRGAVEILIGFSIALVAAENLWLLARRDRTIAASFLALIAAAGVLSLGGVGVLGPLSWAGLALFTICHFRLLAEGEASARMRSAVALAFGLVHGLGFAAILMEMDLPASRLAPALLGFNAGVELGQLAFVAVCWPLLAWLEARGPAWRLGVAETGSAFALGLGIFWVVVRSLATP